MKKIKEKLSYFTKVLLAFGLLFSNLTSLSYVFAYEVTEDFMVEINDKNIEITVLDEIEDTDLVKVFVDENYTYLDGSGEFLENEYTYSGMELTNGVELVSTMLSDVLFDGLYQVSVSLYNETDDTEIGTIVKTKNVEFESGLQFRVYNKSNNEEILPVDGKYLADDALVVESKILSGGLTPSDTFSYESVEYTSLELLDLVNTTEVDYTGMLFGDYTETVELTFLNENLEEVVFSGEIAFSYGEYADNTDVLNYGIATEFPEYIGKYAFFGDSEEGTLYVLTDNIKGYSVLELYNILESATNGSELVTYKIGNSQYEDILLGYETALEENPELLLEEFLNEIVTNNSTVITLTSGDLTITYRCILAGDLNDDSIVNLDDLYLMINQVIGKEEANSELSDVYIDGEVNLLDVIYFNQVLKNNDWLSDIIEEEATFNARLETSETDIASGDEFTVNYIVNVEDNDLSGILGSIDYDKNFFELVAVEANSELIGDNYEGKYLYLTLDSLTGEVSIVDDEEVILPKEYTLLTLTFRALTSGTSIISVNDSEFFNQEVYYNGENENPELEVTVNESSNNTLSSLTISGVDIELVEGTLSYEITVPNATTEALVTAIAENLKATVTSIITPEELVEGENTITIVVTAENGDELIYTVTVVREKAPEGATTPTNVNYSTNSDDDNVLNDAKDNETLTPVEEPNGVKDGEEESNVTRIIIIILILLVIAGLIYLIFKDEKNDEESKKVNKDINKLKKDKEFSEKKKENSEKKKSTSSKNNSKKER